MTGATTVGAIADAQGGLCYLCGRAFSADLPPTREHVVPRVAGGRNHGNILAACTPCNGAKGDRLPHPHEIAILEAINLQLCGRTRPVRPQPVPSSSPREQEKRRLFAIEMEKARIIRMGGDPEAMTDGQRRRADLANWRAQIAIFDGRGFSSSARMSA